MCVFRRVRICLIVLFLSGLTAAVGGSFAFMSEKPVIWTRADKKIALTFDDGPDPRYTALLLDGLQARGIRATFFVIGEKARDCPELIQRMKQEGHLIGNHTFTHVQLNRLSSEQACCEIQAVNDLLEALCGEPVLYLRPPYGSWERKKECPLDMIPVYWDVDPLDWNRSDIAGIVRDVVRKTEPGDIILLHDIYESSVKAAFEIIDDLLLQGYEFVTVEELLFI